MKLNNQILCFFYVLLVTLTSRIASAQSPFMKNYNYQAIVTKSPEAAAISKFGEVPINTSTGVPDITIPLENIKITDKLSLPISISYHAGGLRVEDVTGIVGLHWSLIAGGSVDKDINGKNDDDYYFANSSNIPTIFNQMRDEVSSSASLLRKDFLRNAIDMNQDSYSFSVMGNYDNIYFAQGLWRSEFNNKKFSITKDVQQFRIVNDDGTKYYFGKNPDNASVATGYSSSTFSTVPGFYDPDNIPTVGGITSWKLLKVESTSGPALNIEYSGTQSIAYDTRASEVTTTSQNLGGDPPPCGCAPTMLYANYTAKEFASPLMSIITGIDKRVEFSYIVHPSYATAKLLSAITVRSLNGNLIKKITFHYSGFGSGRPELKLDELRIYDGNEISYQKYNFGYNTASLPSFGSLDRDMFGYYNQAGNSYLLSSDDPSALYKAASRTPSLAATQAMINKIIYPTGGSTEFEYELNKEGSNYAPGIRVKKITDHDPVTAKDLITEYAYSGLNGGINFPYNAAAKIHIKQNCIEKSFNSEILNPEISLKNYGYARVVTIKKGDAGNLDIIHEDKYDYSIKKFDNSLYAVKYHEVDYTNTAGGLIPNTSHKYNYGSTEDRSVEVPFYQSGGTHTELRPGPIDPTPNCETIYDGVSQLSPLYSKSIFKIEQIDTTFTSSNPIISHLNFSYEDPLNELPSKISSQTSQGTYLINKIKYPTFYQNLSAGTDVQNLKENHILNEPVESSLFSSPDGILLTHLKSDFFEYNNWNPFLKNVYQIESTPLFTESFSSTGNIIKDVNYRLVASLLSYDANGNLLSARKTDGTISSYIYDHSSNLMAIVSNSEISDVAYTSFENNDNGNWSINGAVINTSKSLTGKRSITLNSGNSINGTNYSPGIYMVCYWTDNSGLTVNGTNGIIKQTNLGWIYKEHQVTLSANDHITVQGNGTIDELRFYPANSFITSYTYEPLVGMTSQTDPKGLTTYYEYDGFGRLAYVKNQNRDIIKSYCYNYAGQVTDCNFGTPPATTYYNVAKSASFTRSNCGSGGTGGTVTYTISAGTYSSTSSQADADNQAISAVNAGGQAYANANGSCGYVYYNVAKSGSFTRNNCGTGGTGGTVTYTISAGTYSSTSSQADADNQAVLAVNAGGQAYANANAACSYVYYNVAKSGSFTRNNCGAGGSGSTVTYTIAAGAYSSTSSQADADNQAVAAVNAGGQAYANANANCSYVYYNTAQSGSFTRNNCGAGGTGGTVTYTVATGAYSSTSSQADADNQAIAAVNAGGQAYANANATCSYVYYNTAQSGSFTRNNCGAGGTGSTVTYTVGAGAYSSTSSQTDANNQAIAAVNAGGQAYANANAGCTFLSQAQSANFTKNDCGPGGNGGTLTYSIPAENYSSSSSLADANAQALAALNAGGQTYANANAGCTYYNTYQSGQFQKTDCADGTGSFFTHTVAAGVYSSTISQQDANNQAGSMLNSTGPGMVNLYGFCTFYNDAQTANFTKNDCAGGGIGGTVSFTIPANSYSSTYSKADANFKAVSALNIQGPGYANANAGCTFYNTAQSGVFTRTNCTGTGIGGSITYTVAAGQYSSSLSVADANSQAMNAVNAGGPGYANINATCTYYNTVQSQGFLKNDCGSGGGLNLVTYTVAAGIYSSTVSQGAADQLALNDISANGQTYANIHGQCAVSFTISVDQITYSVGEKINILFHYTGTADVNFEIVVTYPDSSTETFGPQARDLFRINTMQSGDYMLMGRTIDRTTGAESLWLPVYFSVN